jgi:hypothetical protein
MRWSRSRSEYVLHLRCILLNGQWDELAAHLASQGTLQLAATPTQLVRITHRRRQLD